MLKVLAVPGKCAAQAVVAVPPAVPRSDHLEKPTLICLPAFWTVAQVHPECAMKPLT